MGGLQSPLYPSRFQSSAHQVKVSLCQHHFFCLRNWMICHFCFIMCFKVKYNGKLNCCNWRGQTKNVASPAFDGRNIKWAIWKMIEKKKAKNRPEREENSSSLIVRGRKCSVYQAIFLCPYLLNNWLTGCWRKTWTIVIFFSHIEKCKKKTSMTQLN